MGKSREAPGELLLAEGNTSSACWKVPKMTAWHPCLGNLFLAICLHTWSCSIFRVYTWYVNRYSTSCKTQKKKLKISPIQQVSSCNNHRWRTSRGSRAKLVPQLNAQRGALLAGMWSAAWCSSKEPVENPRLDERWRDILPTKPTWHWKIPIFSMGNTSSLKKKREKCQEHPSILHLLPANTSNSAEHPNQMKCN